MLKKYIYISYHTTAAIIKFYLFIKNVFKSLKEKTIYDFDEMRDTFVSIGIFFLIFQFIHRGYTYNFSLLPL